MRILLTGSSGFIGRHLLAVLLAEGHHVVCTTRKPGRNSATGTSTGVSTIAADFTRDTDKSSWLARLAQIDVVINAVGVFRESGMQTFANLHSNAPRALFAACAESGSVRVVVQLSAIGADEGAASAYHLSKKEADDYLSRLPLRAWIVQPSLVYGKDGASTRVFKALASMPFTVRFGSAQQLVQPVHVDDVVAAIATLIRTPPPVSPSGNTVQRVPLVGPRPLDFTDYLGALRAAMGMGKQRVLRLPGRVASLLAALGRWLPGTLLDPDTIRMLDRGNTGDPTMLSRLLGRSARPVTEFITDPAAERAQAKLVWLLPILRASIALVWIVTAIVSAGLFPVAESYALLARTGIAPALQPLMLYGAVGFDLLMGLGILLLPRRRWLWLAQLVLIGFYTTIIAWKLPEFLLHPYGPLTKNLPMLAAIWLLVELEEN